MKLIHHVRARSLVLPGLVLALLSCGWATTGETEEATALRASASRMRPGQWLELKSEGYSQDALMRGDDLLAYAGRAAWDAKSRQILLIGQVHLKGPPVFIAYSAVENRWRRMPTPRWAENLKWFHAYENNAADSAGGIFYHHQSDSGLVHKYVAAKGEWSTLPELKAAAGHGTAIEYFPERKGLVRVFSGDVWFFSDEAGTWSRLATKLEMGPYHNFAAYSPRFKAVLFGGGNGSRALHVLHADGKVTTGRRAPVELGIGRSLNVVDPVSGELLVLAKGGKLFAYNPGKDEWRELPSEGLPFAKYGGHSVSAAPISQEGVVLFFSSNPQGMKTYLYKHAE